MQKGKLVLGAAALVAAVGGFMPTNATAGETAPCEGSKYICDSNWTCLKNNDDGTCSKWQRTDVYSDTKAGEEE